MKHIVLFLGLSLLVLTSSAQGNSADLGKIVYYEGKVELGSDPTWVRAKINAPVNKNQQIRIPGDGMAEIQWNNGTKSVVGPNSRIAIQALFTGSSGKAKNETEEVFTGFKTMFNGQSGSQRTQEGGIRRSMAETRARMAPGEVYWKEETEISFDEAYTFYEAGEYGQAISAFQAFLHQKPEDEMARYAVFALGHSYIMANNTVKAREIFEQFVTDYPSDPLRAEAEKVLAKL